MYYVQNSKSPKKYIYISALYKHMSGVPYKLVKESVRERAAGESAQESYVLQLYIL